MSWSFRQEAKIGAETALDACDYFVDDVLDVWQAAGCYGRMFNFKKIDKIIIKQEHIESEFVFFTSFSVPCFS